MQLLNSVLLFHARHVVYGRWLCDQRLHFPRTDEGPRPCLSGASVGQIAR